MKINELPKMLSVIPPTQAALILGPPGVGKSTAIKEFAKSEAKRLGREFIDYDDDDELFLKISKNPEKFYVFLDFRLSEVEPTDFLGVPRDIDHFIVYKPLRWVQVFSHPNAAGLLFLDELTNVRREDILAQAYKLVLDRRAGFRKFSDNVRIIAAGNHPEHSTVANLLPSPLANRFAIFDIDASDVYEWIEYVDSVEGNIDPRIAGYLSRFPSDLIKKSDAETLENFPTPRSWSRLNQVLRGDITNIKIIRELAQSLLGKEVAHKFATFCRLAKYLPSPEEILKNPEVLDRRIDEKDEKELTKLDLYYYAIAVVSEHIKKNKARIDDVVRFAKKIFNYQGDLLVVFLKMVPSELKGALALELSNIPEVREAVSSIAKYL